MSPGTLRKYRSRYNRSLSQKKSQASKKSVSNKKNNLSLPEQCDFETHCKVFSYPAYYGLYEFQEEIHLIVWDENNKYIVIVVPRDHGKSIYLGNLFQWIMQWKSYDVLLLGWTDRRKEIAENVFNFFLMWELIEEGTHKPASPYHFKIKNGGRFDTYSITSKDILGKHGVGKQERFDKLTKEDLEGFDEEFTEIIKELYLKNRDPERKLLIAIDDPQDETFREERWKEEKLEMKSRSTIFNINPDKFIFSGTRKFEEDYFYFLDLTYGDKLVKYVRRTHLCTPHVDELYFDGIDFSKLDKSHPGYTVLLEKLKERIQNHSCYNPNLITPEPRYKSGLPPAENLLCPERWTEEKLQEKRQEIREYWWFAEYEGNPHPITGEVWDTVFYVPAYKDWMHYDFFQINVDRATTTKKTSSYTGITELLREVKTGYKLVIKDLTARYKFDDALDLVEEQYEWLRKAFPNVRALIPVEKQGGGDDFISSAESRGYKFANYIVPVHQRRDKLERIRDYLEVSINKGMIKFLDTLCNSELIKEILNFPYSVRLDAIDSLATGVKVLEDYPLGNIGDKLEGLTMELKTRRLKAEIKQRSPVYDNPIQNPNYYKQRRGW